MRARSPDCAAPAQRPASHHRHGRWNQVRLVMCQASLRGTSSAEFLRPMNCRERIHLIRFPTSWGYSGFQLLLSRLVRVPEKCCHGRSATKFVTFSAFFDASERMRLKQSFRASLSRATHAAKLLRMQSNFSDPVCSGISPSLLAASCLFWRSPPDDSFPHQHSAAYRSQTPACQCCLMVKRPTRPSPARKALSDGLQSLVHALPIYQLTGEVLSMCTRPPSSQCEAQ